MNIQIDGFCEIGLQRPENQDSIFYDAADGRVLAIVADGMGGHADGGKASGLTVDKVRQWWQLYGCRVKKPAFENAMRELELVLCDAHEEISQLSEDGLSGTTAVLFWAEAGEWAVLSVGDSRCYMSKNTLFSKKTVQVTVDDVWENQPEVLNHYTRLQIQNNQNFGKLVRAVGGGGSFSCSKYRGHCEPGMIFSLCSDGVYRYCGERTWNLAFQALHRNGELGAVLDMIRQDIYANEAPDNLSMILVRIFKS